MGSCERGILSYNTTRKGGGVHTEIMLPLHAPPSFSDHSALWNSVELYEKAGNAQLTWEIDAALPIELSREEQIRLVREYCSSQFVSKGMCVDFAIHDTNKGNPHCHIMLTMRPLDEIPTVHMGVAACQMEKKGITTEKVELNRNIQKANRMIKEIRGADRQAQRMDCRIAYGEGRSPGEAAQSPDLANLLMKYLSV